jgi:hypothetical protein
MFNICTKRAPVNTLEIGSLFNAARDPMLIV